MRQGEDFDGQWWNAGTTVARYVGLSQAGSRATTPSGERYEGEERGFSSASGAAASISSTAAAAASAAPEGARPPERELSEVQRDFISRAFMQEIAVFPERIQDFVEANQRRIQQSVGDTSWL